MKVNRKKKRVVIKSASIEEYETQFNETADRLAEFDPEIKDVDTFPGYLCTIFSYEEVEEHAQTEEERYYLDGIKFTCSECPYFMHGDDARRKWWRCEKFDRRRHSESSACGFFYDELSAGRIEVKK